MGQRGYDQFAIFSVPHRTSTNTAAAGFVNFSYLGLWGNDLRRGRVVGRLDVSHQVRDAGLGIVEHVDARTQHFVKIVRWNIRCHTHGNASTAIEQ